MRKDKIPAFIELTFGGGGGEVEKTHHINQNQCLNRLHKSCITEFQSKSLFKIFLIFY